METYINQQFQTCSEKLTEKALNNFKFEVQTNNFFFLFCNKYFQKDFQFEMLIFLIKSEEYPFDKISVEHSKVVKVCHYKFDF